MRAVAVPLFALASFAGGGMNKHIKRVLMTGVLGLAAAVLSTAVAEGQDSGVSLHPMIGEEAPAFDLEEVGGGILSLESLKGNYIVLHFGASW
jgi:prephenate dehydrogenase